jgi:hypothetical protein
MQGEPQFRLGANNENARSVLLRALALITPPNANTLAWFLFCGSPADPSYALNLIPVPGTSVPTPAQKTRTTRPIGGSATSVTSPVK